MLYICAMSRCRLTFYIGYPIALSQEALVKACTCAHGHRFILQTNEAVCGTLSRRAHLRDCWLLATSACFTNARAPCAWVSEVMSSFWSFISLHISSQALAETLWHVRSTCHVISARLLVLGGYICPRRRATVAGGISLTSAPMQSSHQ